MSSQREYPAHPDGSVEVEQPVHSRRDFIRCLLAGVAATATTPLPGCLPTGFRETTTPTVAIDSALLSPVSAIPKAQPPDFRQLIEELRLLARSIMVVDGLGIVRYIQVVPEISHLPDMEKAFNIASELNGKH